MFVVFFECKRGKFALYLIYNFLDVVKEGQQISKSSSFEFFFVCVYQKVLKYYCCVVVYFLSVRGVSFL